MTPLNAGDVLVVDYEREPRLTLVAEAAALAGEAPPCLPDAAPAPADTFAGDAQDEDGAFVTIKDVTGQDGSGELYGWVPRDLVNASPAKLVRALASFAPAAIDGDMTMDRRTRSRRSRPAPSGPPSAWPWTTRAGTTSGPRRLRRAGAAPRRAASSRRRRAGACRSRPRARRTR